LGPQLEQAAWDVLVATVAHELAHVALKHSILTDPKHYQTQEQEAERCLNEWGFELEARKHKLSKRRRKLI
jgi:predicted Zn-dependent protease